MRLLPLVVLVVGACGPALEVQALELSVIHDALEPRLEVNLSRFSEGCAVPADAVVSANGVRLRPPHRAPLAPEPCHSRWLSEDLRMLEVTPLVLDVEYEGSHLQAHFGGLGPDRTLTVTSPANGFLHDAQLVSGAYQSPVDDLNGVEIYFLNPDVRGVHLGSSVVSDGRWVLELPREMQKGDGVVTVRGIPKPIPSRCDFVRCRFVGTGITTSTEADFTVQ
jgi:hypothetical protein